jgi:hypothetical protein
MTGRDCGKVLNKNNGLRNQGLSQQLCGKTGIKDPLTREQLRLGNERTISMIYRKAIRLEIVKPSIRDLQRVSKNKEMGLVER